MVKKTKDAIKIAVVIIIGILTFNVVYDVGISNSMQEPKVEENGTINSLDKVKAIAEEEAKGSVTRPAAVVETESKTGKVIKYVSIVGILILAITMLIVLSNKEDLDE